MNKHKQKYQRQKKRRGGNTCGCSGGNSALSKLFSGGRKTRRHHHRKIHGGSVGFHADGMPGNAYPLTNLSNGDPSRLSISARMSGGSRYKKSRKRKQHGGGLLGMFGSGFQDPMGGGGNDIVSAFGTSGGAALSANILGGKPIDGGAGGGALFNSSIKPMV